jgi:hypothetical protein
MLPLLHLAPHVLASLLAQPPADTSGVSNAFIGLAKLGGAMLGGVIAFFGVVCGFQYIAAVDDAAKAMHAKRAIGCLLVGAIIVAVSVNFAPQIVSVIFP